MERAFNIKLFGQNLRMLRKRKGFSQEGFALHAGLDRTYIGGIERGERNPALKTILQLAEALEADVVELFRCQG